MFSEKNVRNVRNSSFAYKANKTMNQLLTDQIDKGKRSITNQNAISVTVFRP